MSGVAGCQLFVLAKRYTKRELTGTAAAAGAAKEGRSKKCLPCFLLKAVRVLGLIFEFLFLTLGVSFPFHGESLSARLAGRLES